MMEAEPMAHLTLQIGAAIIVPVGPRRRTARRRLAQTGATGSGAASGQPIAWPASHLLAARVHGLKIGRALSSTRETV